MSATRDDMAAFFDIHGFQRGISRDGCNSLTQNFSAFLYNDLIDASGQPRPLADIADDALYREIHTADAKAAFQTPYRPAMLDAIAEANPYLLPIARLFYGDSTFFHLAGATGDNAEIRIESARGVTQGCPCGSTFFALVAHPPLLESVNRVREHDPNAVCAAIIDDVAFGTDGRHATLKQSNSILREEMGKVGIQYYDTTHRKVVAYCPARSLGLTDPPESEPGVSDPSGVVLAGIPLGNEAFVTGCLADFASKASSLIKNCKAMADCGFGSQAVVLMRQCVHPKTTHLCRSLTPTGSPNIRDESSPQQFAGDLKRFEDPAFPLAALHIEVTAGTLYCAGADLSDVDVSLDSVTSRQLGLPFRLGGAGLRDPATIRKAAYLSANRSAAQYAASDGTLWECHTRPDTTVSALRQEVESHLSPPLRVHLPPFYTPSSSQAVIDDVRNSRPDKDVQSKLQSAVDKTNRESLLMISNLPKEELIRVRSVVCPNARQYMHSTFVQPSMKNVPGFIHYSHKDLTPLTNDTWCLAFCRRFGVPYARLPSTATHHSGCDSCAGVNGAHAIVCSFSRAPRTWRTTVRDAFAYAARKRLSGLRYRRRR